MLFTSIDFAIFLPAIFILYWLVPRDKVQLQNFLIVIASVIFYGWWSWRFLLLIFVSICIDFLVGIRLSSEGNALNRKLLLWLSIAVNIGFLGFFKYYNFFLDNFVTVFSFCGGEISGNSLNIILPVGISFYTFQTLSYTIDVYKRKLEPTKDFFAFSAFVSFFPQLVAGPIERATNLLPQFYKKRTFDYTKAVDGMRQILWGLFKKIVIADNCAQYATQIFNNSGDYTGSTLTLGALFFAFQVYGDFSGYSDIAIGTSRLFGFDLKRNFRFPYFSRDIAEFWRSWHISLSTWFRDYLYIPLGGSRGGFWMKVRNTFLIFIVSGFWHGANWTFVIWGALNAFYFLPLLVTKNNRVNMQIVAKGNLFPSVKEALSMLLTFGLIVFAWIFFRADNIAHAVSFISKILSPSLFDLPTLSLVYESSPTMLLVLLFVMVEWLGREDEYAIEKIMSKWNWRFRFLMYYLIILISFWFGGQEQEFIYFQF